jgi:hypothetical protein
MDDLPVRHRTLAPFGGITRIRFKGSVAGATLSAIAAPPQYCFLLRIGLVRAKSTTSKIVIGLLEALPSCRYERYRAIAL